MNSYNLNIKPFGKHAILVEWPNEVDEAILKDILQFARHLEKNCLSAGEWEMIPAYNSLTLIHNGEIDLNKINRELRVWYPGREEGASLQRHLWKLPVCYDLEFGIDLEELSAQSGRSVEDIRSLHASTSYRLFGIGFVPGFMYLGGLPRALETPRKSSPRLKVLKGAVGLAGRQTGIYPQESPGGWNIIGNCPIPMFNPENKPPCFVSVGDKIQFYPITKGEHELHKIQAEVGLFKIEKIRLDD